MHRMIPVSNLFELVHQPSWARQHRSEATLAAKEVGQTHLLRRETNHVMPSRQRFPVAGLDEAGLVGQLNASRRSEHEDPTEKDPKSECAGLAEP